MSTNEKLAERMRGALKLATPPVALSFHDQAPSGVERFSGSVPAGCAFWERGTTSTFATEVDDHLLCAIGVHTHRLADAPESQGRELEDSVAAMIGLDYVREDEVAAIPVMAREHRVVVYGPLRDHPVEPDAVLVFGNARQGLVLAEAAGRVDGGAPPAMGRPACALVPQVISRGAAAMSLGCCGARAYLGTLSDDMALWGLPGARLEAYVRELEVLGRANEALAAFHLRRRDDVAGGERPTVRQSLDRLGRPGA